MPAYNWREPHGIGIIILCYYYIIIIIIGNDFNVSFALQRLSSACNNSAVLESPLINMTAGFWYEKFQTMMSRYVDASGMAVGSIIICNV